MFWQAYCKKLFWIYLAFRKCLKWPKCLHHHYHFDNISFIPKEVGDEQIEAACETCVFSICSSFFWQHCLIWEKRDQGPTTNLRAVVLNQPLLPIVSLKYISEQHSAFPNDLILVCNSEMFALSKSVQFSRRALWTFISFLWFFPTNFLHRFETSFTRLFLEKSSKAL